MVYICVTHTFFRLSTDTRRLFPLVVGIVGDVHVLASAKVIGWLWAWPPCLPTRFFRLSREDTAIFVEWTVLVLVELKHVVAVSVDVVGVDVVVDEIIGDDTVGEIIVDDIVDVDDVVVVGLRNQWSAKGWTACCRRGMAFGRRRGVIFLKPYLNFKTWDESYWSRSKWPLQTWTWTLSRASNPFNFSWMNFTHARLMDPSFGSSCMAKPSWIVLLHPYKTHRFPPTGFGFLLGLPSSSVLLRFDMLITAIYKKKTIHQYYNW